MDRGKMYRKRPVEVLAKKFDRNDPLSSAYELFVWTDGHVFYVPAGADHNLRIPHEYDEHGFVKDDAKPFIVVWTPDGLRRADMGDYIVCEGDGKYRGVTQQEFNERYREVDNDD